MLRDVNTVNPINWEHSYNTGTLAWFLALPGNFGGNNFFDLVKRRLMTPTGISHSTGGARPSSRPGGYGHMLYSGSGAAWATASDAGLPTGTAKRSISCWARVLANSGSFPTIFAYGTNAVGQYYGLTLDSGASFKYALTVSGSVMDSSVIADAKWHHIAVTWDGTTHTIYVDGVSKGTGTNSINTTLAGSGGIAFGDVAPIGGHGCNCEMDDGQISNRCWAAPEVMGRYLQGRRGYPTMLNRIPWILSQPKLVAASAFRRTEFDRVGSRGAA